MERNNNSIEWKIEKEEVNKRLFLKHESKKIAELNKNKKVDRYLLK